MDDKLNPEAEPREDRRKFLGRAGKTALGVPATAVLLSVTNKSAKAWIDPYEPKIPCNGCDPVQWS